MSGQLEDVHAVLHFKGTFHETQMLAEVHIVISIEKRIVSALR